MRIFNTLNDPLPLTGDSGLPILFTGSAIAYLSFATASINISEWQSHEDIIDGRRILIITDKLPHRDAERLT